MNVYLKSLFLVILLCSASTTFAQRSAIGPRVGASISTFSYDPDPPSYVTIGYATGLALGLEFNHWFTHSLALAPQFLYVQKGGNQELNADERKYKYEITATYMEIPVYIKYAIGENQVRPYFFAGPALGLLLSADSRTKVEDIDTTGSIKDQFTGSDFCFNFGAGLSIEASETMEIVFDATYSIGLSDVAEDRPNSEQTFQAFNNSIRIMGGVLFRL